MFRIGSVEDLVEEAGELGPDGLRQLLVIGVERVVCDINA